MVDVVANMSMVTININLGQAMADFSENIWKIALYNIHLSERVRVVVMACQKLVGYWFIVLKIHIHFEDVMCI